MKKHREACASVFRERVLPHFPKAQERFTKYFRESYGLIKAMPMTTLLYFEQLLLPHLNRVFDLEVALTVLGVKPLTLCETGALNLLVKKHGVALIENAGLEIRVARKFFGIKQFQVYDPVLAAPALSRVLNRNVATEKVGDALEQISRFENPDLRNPYDLFGYPQPLNNTPSSVFLIVGSQGNLPLPFLYYRTKSLSCALAVPTMVLPELEAWASTAAIVEEIREHPKSIVSRASLIPDFPDLEESRGEQHIITVERSKDIGDWCVTSSTSKHLNIF